MTSHRPYRRAMSWDSAKTEIFSQRERQFDPDVVDAFSSVEQQLRGIRRELAAA
jgi:response regulator RpfG family c-di-GMP phosphodiesterase